MPRPLPNHSDGIEFLEPFSKIKLIALDLDGTIFSSGDSEIPRTIIDLSNQLKSAKVVVTIATGRTLCGAQAILDSLPTLKQTPSILYNGSVVINANYEILYQKWIHHTIVKKILELCSKYSVILYAYVCNSQDLGKGEVKEKVYGWSNLNHPTLEYNKMFVNWQKWSNCNREATPSTIVIHVNRDIVLMDIICQKLKSIEGISFTRGGSIYIEVYPCGSNKGKALDFIATELFKFAPEQVLAMGDNDNDAEMLEWAGIGVAVEHASTIAKSKSDYFSRGVLDGAIEVLRLVKRARILYEENS